MSNLGASSLQKLNFDNSSQKTRKIRYQIYVALSNSTGFFTLFQLSCRDCSEIHQFVCFVDDSHIPILAPGENKGDCFNRKNTYSVTFWEQQILIFTCICWICRQHSRLPCIAAVRYLSENRTRKFTTCTPQRNKWIPNHWRLRFPESKLDNKALC